MCTFTDLRLTFPAIYMILWVSEPFRCSVARLRPTFVAIYMTSWLQQTSYTQFLVVVGCDTGVSKYPRVIPGNPE